METYSVLALARKLYEEVGRAGLSGAEGSAALRIAQEMLVAEVAGGLTLTKPAESSGAPNPSPDTPRR